MSKVMKLGDILESLDDTTEKIAAVDNTVAVKSTKVAETKQELLNSLNSETTEKVASTTPVADPTEDLEKIAARVAQAEEESIVKEAQLYGASVCDGFMQRMSMYEKTAAENNEVVATPLEDFHKVASSHYQDENGTVYTAQEVQEAINAEEPSYGQEKFAHESFPGVEFTGQDLEIAEGIIKEAAHNGIHLSDEDAIEKVAHDAFELGFQDMMEKCAEEAGRDGYTHVMEKAADLAHAEGYMDIMEAHAEKLAEAGELETVEAMEKAAFDSGYGDAMEKIAGSAYSTGYSDMSELLPAQA